jgi:hypothetical protein
MQAQDVNFAMEASRKSRFAFAAANVSLGENKAGESISSIKTALDFYFQDVEGCLRLVRHAMAVKESKVVMETIQPWEESNFCWCILCIKPLRNKRKEADLDLSATLHDSSRETGPHQLAKLVHSIHFCDAR